MALTVSCLVYLGWLSGTVLLVTLVFLAVAIASVKFLVKKAHKLLQLAREEQDRLFRNFRTITDGIKELKLHPSLREAFLTQDLEKTQTRSEQNTATIRRHR